MKLREVIDVGDGTWPHELIGADTDLHRWIARMGVSGVGYIKAIRLLGEGEIAIEFYTDSEFRPTLSAQEMHVEVVPMPERMDVAEMTESPEWRRVDGGWHFVGERVTEVRTVWATIQAGEPPPSWPED